MAGHLPDPATASPSDLQMAADVMRARRLPEDALEYYRFALERGGDPGKLTNRIGDHAAGVASPGTRTRRLPAFGSPGSQGPRCLEQSGCLGVRWRRLSRAAIGDYKRAVKLNKNKATFHSNLGTAYFEVKDYDSARKQFATALKLDPNALQGGTSNGIEAHVLSPSDRGRFCFEMAKLAARDHDKDGETVSAGWRGRPRWASTRSPRWARIGYSGRI